MKNSDDIPKRVGKFISIICLGTIISLNSCSSTKDTKTAKTGMSENVIIDYLRGGNNYDGISLGKSWTGAYTWPSIETDPPDHNFFFSPYSNYRRGAEYSVSGEVVDGPIERRRMMELSKKYWKYPEKSKYAAQLGKKYGKLMQKRGKRINRKLNFLKELYNRQYQRFQPAMPKTQFQYGAARTEEHRQEGRGRHTFLALFLQSERTGSRENTDMPYQVQ